MDVLAIMFAVGGRDPASARRGRILILPPWTSPSPAKVEGEELAFGWWQCQDASARRGRRGGYLTSVMWPVKIWRPFGL